MQQWANELVKSLDSLLGDKFATMELEALCNLLEDIAMLAANIHHTELLQETLAVMKVMMLGDYGSLQGLCKRQEFVRMHTLLTAMCGPVTVGKSQV